MKITNLYTITFLFCFTLLSAHSNADSSDYYVGDISAADILTKFPDFAQHSADKTYQGSFISALNKLEGNIEIKVFFGQWCHDSVREVPRIITMLQQANNPNIKPWYYALDTNKSDPLLLAESHNIKKTPTVIVYKEGVELGRILEFPQMDWATDVAGLFNK